MLGQVTMHVSHEGVLLAFPPLSPRHDATTVTNRGIMESITVIMTMCLERCLCHHQRLSVAHRSRVAIARLPCTPYDRGPGEITLWNQRLSSAYITDKHNP